MFSVRKSKQAYRVVRNWHVINIVTSVWTEFYDANLVCDGYQIHYSKLRKYMYSGPKVSKDATPTDTENYAAYVFMNFFSMELHFSIGFNFCPQMVQAISTFYSKLSMKIDE